MAKDFDISYYYHQRDKYDKLMGEVLDGTLHLEVKGKEKVDSETQKKKDLLLFKYYESQFNMYEEAIKREEEYSKLMME